MGVTSNYFMIHFLIMSCDFFREEPKSLINKIKIHRTPVTFHSLLSCSFCSPPADLHTSYVMSLLFCFILPLYRLPRMPTPFSLNLIYIHPSIHSPNRFMLCDSGHRRGTPGRMASPPQGSRTHPHCHSHNLVSPIHTHLPTYYLLSYTGESCKLKSTVMLEIV